MDLELLPQYSAYSIPVDLIFCDVDFNCRGEFVLDSVRDLADSIQEAGRLIHPVLVQPWTDKHGHCYRLIAGYRRFKAMTIFLKVTAVPAVIVTDLTTRQARLLNLLENLERKDLNILEEARALKRLYPKGAPCRQVAKELKQSVDWVLTRWWLLKMPEEIQKKAAAGLLSAANIKTLASMSTPDERLMVADKIADARKRGRGNRLPGLDRKWKLSKVRTREDINAMVERMLLAGITGLPPRVGAWCAGHIPDEDLLAEIEIVTKETPTSHLSGGLTIGEAS
jgi:ParB/RepB/Spo0J family partition protein